MTLVQVVYVTVCVGVHKRGVWIQSRAWNSCVHLFRSSQRLKPHRIQVISAFSSCTPASHSSIGWIWLRMQNFRLLSRLYEDTVIIRDADLTNLFRHNAGYITVKPGNRHLFLLSSSREKKKTSHFRFYCHKQSERFKVN